MMTMPRSLLALIISPQDSSLAKWLSHPLDMRGITGSNPVGTIRKG